MNKIKFIPAHFFDFNTMKFDSIPSEEQWQRVKEVCNTLNYKNSQEVVCSRHPEKEQHIQVGIFNNKVDLQVDKKETCGCYDAFTKLVEIKRKELLMFDKMI